MKYPVVEIFSSIQGEGMHSGKPANFIRLAGCNLRCGFCDTKESWSVDTTTMLTAAEIVAQLNPSYKLTVITGGEPTIHDLKPLCLALGKSCYYIAVETNGTNVINTKYIDWVTCSPKEQNLFNISCLANELKYVVDDNFSFKDISTYFQGPIFLNPESARDDMTMKACNIVLSNPNRRLRLGVQLHKLVGVR